MFRRIFTVFVLTLGAASGAGVIAAPSASAAPLCGQVVYRGVVTFGPPVTCVAYPLAVDCTSGIVLLGIVGQIDDYLCVPAV